MSSGKESSSVQFQPNFRKQLLEQKISTNIVKTKDLLKKINPIPIIYSPAEVHPDMTKNKQPVYSQEVNYHEAFWKLYMKNEEAFTFAKSLEFKVEEVKHYIHEIEKLQIEYRKFTLSNSGQKQKRKNRRFSSQIQKKFVCPYPRCYKDYGSDVSLNLHIKLKHNGGNKTDRQKLAVIQPQQQEAICQAEEKNQTPPQIEINLPPGFLDEYREKFKTRAQYSSLINPK